MKVKQYKPVSGFLFTLLAVTAWATTPIAIKLIINYVDVNTIAFYRFFVSGVALYILQQLVKRKEAHRTKHQYKPKKVLPNLKRNHSLLMLSPRFRWVLLLAVLSLAANFVLYNVSLKYISASVYQVIAQIEPFIMMFLGVLFLKERMYFPQKLGSVVTIAGIILFFNKEILDFVTGDLHPDHTFGLIIAFASAIIWSFYGLAQKVMLRRFSAKEVLIAIYFMCAIIFTPFTEFSQIFYLPTAGLFIAFAICCLNTCVGYGAYAEALNRWDMIKICAMLPITPLICMLVAYICYLINPELFEALDLNLLAYIGAFIVVAGSIYSALGGMLSSYRRSQSLKKKRAFNKSRIKASS